MRYYKVIARDLDGYRTRESEPLTWAECEAVFNAYGSFDDVASVSIIFLGLDG